jgi:hypothetical protein
MNKIELKFKGSVFDLKVELEGKEVGLYFDGTSEWNRILENFPIEGELDIIMFCKGLNGTKWELEIKVDGKGPKKFEGNIEKGYSLLSKKIQIPLN